jgi:hypothetical protein
MSHQSSAHFAFRTDGYSTRERDELARPSTDRPRGDRSIKESVSS